MKSFETVLAFWNEVWNAHNPAAAHQFVTDDVVLVVGGNEIRGKEKLMSWIAEFLVKVKDLAVEPIETFQNEDGTGVTSRWMLTGTNNGLLGTEADGQPIAMSGITVWEVDGDGKITRIWVELASMEQYDRLLAR